ncbi:putative bifunctional diguanylate cyclase/phosphodiesterase [Pseudoduganella namucuonensis]|uniref:Diguanylate cyclase/phosphodiesterase n=1 Tax=Pseudoduganella namucuonensis TaxID=1035707 RepID=A0A1I7GQC9_9BURK|nr:EAL domain-containing protein [Pseudoduganella namucuonensis]SFU50561.1 diguanylate cyclase/phosphodiesterase [Pseudoduganella namucuonensis]
MNNPPKRDGAQLSTMLGAGQLAAAVSALVIAGLILLVYQLLAQQQALANEARVQAAIVADNISASLMFRDREAASEMLRSFRSAPVLQSVAVYDADGELFADYSTPGHAPAARLDAVAAPPWQSLRVVADVGYRGARLGRVVLVNSTIGIRDAMVRYIALLVLASLGALLVAQLLVRKTRARVAAAERELEYLAHTDPVTTLINRRATYAQLERVLAERAAAGGRAALLLIDLDNFKAVNDAAGHNAGDELLRRVAMELRAVAREGDVVGRIGGDEFAIVTPVADHAEARALAQRVTEALRQPFQIEGSEVFATASVGACTFPDDAATMAQLVSSADTALYHAKKAGRNRLAEFAPEMTLHIQRRLRLERELRRALETGGLEVFYQPQFDCASERMVGAEALLRWRHPEHGFISPAEFIPVAEDSGLIVALGQWVLEQACREAAQWRGLCGLELSVAVNVSVRQLREKDFLDVVIRTLEATGLPAGQLELEVTESVLMEDVQSAVQFMREARAIGVRLSIDDFGTGYSSLAYLQSFPINQLKIDRGFIESLPGDGTTIVNAVISLARDFQLSVVAEGVENREQLAWLQRAGCTYAQGYLLGKPMPADALRQTMRAHTVAAEQAS